MDGTHCLDEMATASDLQTQSIKQENKHLKEINQKLLRQLEAYKTLATSQNHTILHSKLQIERNRGVIDELKNRISEKNEEIAKLQNRVSEIENHRKTNTHHNNRTSRQRSPRKINQSPTTHRRNRTPKNHHTPKCSPRQEGHSSLYDNRRHRSPRRHHQTTERNPRRPSITRHKDRPPRRRERSPRRPSRNGEEQRADAIKQMQRLLQVL